MNVDIQKEKYPEPVEGQNPWYVYIARSRYCHFYTGISPYPESRIKKHNSGKGSQMGAQQGPFVLVYKSIPYGDKSTARTREAQIKKWTKTKKQKLIDGEWQ